MLICINSVAFAQSEMFDKYLKDLDRGKITQSTALKYMQKTETALFNEISQYFDKLQYDFPVDGYISPKDKVHDRTFNWKKHTKDTELKKILKKLSTNPKLALKDPKIAKILKENRNFCQILREEFYIFDQDHMAPKSLEKVVKPFGKLNDAIVAGNLNSIQDYSGQVLSNMKKLDMKTLLSEFQYISKSEFNSYFKNIKKEVSKVLLKKTHTLHDFHWIRKQHKKFLVIYLNLETSSKSSRGLVLDKYISKLGDLNDIYTDMKMRGNINLENHIIKIDPKIREGMSKTLKYLEIDMRTVTMGPSCFSFFKVL